MVLAKLCGPWTGGRGLGNPRRGASEDAAPSPSAGTVRGADRLPGPGERGGRDPRPARAAQHGAAAEPSAGARWR